MAGKRHRVPAARQDDLVVEGFLDEVLVYDLQRNRAHCLNRTAALVWQNCDGRTTVAELAEVLASELEIPANEAMVWMALTRLSKARLLKEPVISPGTPRTYSRRAVMQTLGSVAKISLILPVVQSIVTPSAAQAQSCLANNACSGQPNCIPCHPNAGCAKRCCDGKCIGASSAFTKCGCA